MFAVGLKRTMSSDDEEESPSTEGKKQKTEFHLPVVDPNFMTDEFDHVLHELDFGPRAEANLRNGNGINCMDMLTLRRYDIAMCKLSYISAYDQLRLYFVTEWVGVNGLLSVLHDFNEVDFNKYFLESMQHLAQGTIAITPQYIETGTVASGHVPDLVSALTSETRGFAMSGDYDV
jgi:hypothetical protein